MVLSVELFDTKALSKYPNLRCVTVAKDCNLNYDDFKKTVIPELILKHPIYWKVIKYCQPTSLKINIKKLNPHDEEDEPEEYLAVTKDIVKAAGKCKNLSIVGACNVNLPLLQNVEELTWHDTHNHHSLTFIKNPKLKYLKIFHTKCDLKNLPLLETLIYDKCQNDTPDFKETPKLKTLVIHDVLKLGILPNTLEHLELCGSPNYGGNYNDSAFRNLTNLKTLNIRRLAIKGHFINNLKHLEHLTLYTNPNNEVFELLIKRKLPLQSFKAYVHYNNLEYLVKIPAYKMTLKKYRRFSRT
jgi:hypothetical protein